MYKHILIPTDGSALSQSAAQSGIKLAKSINANVVAFHALPTYKDFLYRIDVRSNEGITEDVFNHLHERMAYQYLSLIKEMALLSGVQYEEYTINDDNAAKAIVKAAEDKKCDLIFIGSHGRSGIVQAILGSVTTKVLSLSDIPVLVYQEAIKNPL